MIVQPAVYTHYCLDEPELSFDPHKQATYAHPLKGLVRYGPYSKLLVGQLHKSVRIATIGPVGTKQVIGRLVKELESPLEPTQRAAYLISYPGFSQTFKLPLDLTEHVHAEITAEDEKRIAMMEARQQSSFQPVG
jgi:hypothetical protein